VKATKQHTEDCKALLRLMGVPVVQAPCEAEAQCAALVRAGLAYAVGSEDMDTLTFGAPRMLRHLTYAESRKMPIVEIVLEDVLRGLGLTMAQFVDVCILMGCDYCDTIRGIGAVRALSLIRQHGAIEEMLRALDLAVPSLGDSGSDAAKENSQEESAPTDDDAPAKKTKYQVPPNWPYKEARDLFVRPSVLPSDDPQIAPDALKGAAADADGLVAFLCTANGFSEDRVRSGIARLAKARASSTHGRLDSFFKVIRPAEQAGGAALNPPAAKKAKAARRGGK
jgi:flap endonuclease-1